MRTKPISLLPTLLIMETQDLVTNRPMDSAPARPHRTGVLIPLFPDLDIPATAAPAPAKVLVVDDNRDAADCLQALFEMENCEVSTAYDGSDAVRAVERDLPDMVVMDLGMPGMDGYEAARRIRELPGAGSILLIALTGWGQGEARQRTAEAGFDHHLIKPVSFDVITDLARKRAAR